MSQPIEGIFIQTTQAEQKQQEKTANILLLPPPPPAKKKITSDEQAQKFHIDETSLTRSSTSN